MTSRLLASLKEALAQPEDLLRRAGDHVILPGAREKIRAMGLVDTGRLYASLAPGHSENVSETLRPEGEFGTAVPYAAFVAAKRGQDFMALDGRAAGEAVVAVADALLEDL